MIINPFLQHPNQQAVMRNQKKKDFRIKLKYKYWLPIWIATTAKVDYERKTTEANSNNTIETAFISEFCIVLRYASLYWARSEGIRVELSSGIVTISIIVLMTSRKILITKYLWTIKKIYHNKFQIIFCEYNFNII